MNEKTFKIVGEDISDGYHTFDELYEHRHLLFLAWILSDGCPGQTYFVREHFAGWDLLCVTLPNAEQISYHIPIRLREIYANHIIEQDGALHVWDGHTSKDVLERIKKWITK